MEGGRNHHLAGADPTPPKYNLAPRVSHIRELPFMTSEVRTKGWSRNEANLRTNIVDSSDRKGEGVNKFPNSVDVKYGSTPKLMGVTSFTMFWGSGVQDIVEE